jgi:predicted transcriptional regulator
MIPKSTQKEVKMNTSLNQNDTEASVVVKIPNEVKNSLIELAKKDQRSLRNFIRKLLTDYVAEREKASDE